MEERHRGLVIIFAPVCVLSLVTDISPILFVVAAAFVGIGLQALVWRKRGKEGGK